MTSYPKQLTVLDAAFGTSRQPILVTGGTGTLGQLVTTRLHPLGVPVRVLSRAPQHGDRNGVRYVTADLATGEGIDAALADCQLLLHLAGTPIGDDIKARRLVDAASRAGVTHVVYISVVGADRIPVSSRADRAAFGYFAAKHAAEQIVIDSGLPWTILRATQFHESLLLLVAKMARFPVLTVPAGLRVQPVAADEVAASLVRLALGPPAGLVPSVAGPKVYEFTHLVRSYMRATGKHRPVAAIHIPGGAAHAIREGALLDPANATGQRTWEQALAAHVEGAAVADRGEPGMHR